MAKPLLVTGATGNQGGALINALLENEEAKSQFKILAVTRDPTSISAQRLALRSPKITLVQGNLDDAPALFRSARQAASEPIWGVFSVQQFMGKGQSTVTEERQGKALVEESIAQGVRHFIQTSVDRGGDKRSWDNPTYVPHFASKHRIELHLRDQAAKANESKKPEERMTWTILRPVAFMDVFEPGSLAPKLFSTAWRDTLGSKPLQLISTTDIGKFAVMAFLHADAEEFKNKAIGLAADELTFEQLNQAFRNKTGEPAATTFGIFGSLFTWAVKDIGLMVKWFKEEGYGADLMENKRLLPDMINFETWLVEKSKFQTK